MREGTARARQLTLVTVAVIVSVVFAASVGVAAHEMITGRYETAAVDYVAVTLVVTAVWALRRYGSQLVRGRRVTARSVAAASVLVLAACSTPASNGPGPDAQVLPAQHAATHPAVLAWGQSGVLNGVTVTVKQPVKSNQYEEDGRQYYAAEVTATSTADLRLQLSYEGRSGGVESPWTASEAATDVLPGETMTSQQLFNAPKSATELVISVYVSGKPDGDDTPLVFRGPLE